MNTSAETTARQQRYRAVRKVTLIGFVLDLFWALQKSWWAGWPILKH